MAVMTQGELLLALERGQFDLIINAEEAGWVDFKEAPYQLQQAHHKWELAKDVAAFANSNGGVIVFGYRSRRPENALVDVATEHRPISKALSTGMRIGKRLPRGSIRTSTASPRFGFLPPLP